MVDEAAAAAGQKRRRTRSGCLNCRRKRKKCDEKRPRCVKCERGNETCEWDSFVKFQPPTGLPPSTTHGLSGPITLQIGSDSEDTVEVSATYSPGPDSSERGPRASDWERAQRQNDHEAPAIRSSVGANRLIHPQKRRRAQSLNNHGFGEMSSRPSISRTSSLRNDENTESHLQRSSPSSAPSGGYSGSRGLDDTGHAHEPYVVPQPSQKSNDRPAIVSPSQYSESWSAHEMRSFVENPHLDLSQLPEHMLSPSISSGYQNEDGVFEPGSRYRDLFKELRNQVIKTAHFDSAPENERTSMVREREASATYPVETYSFQHSGVPDSHGMNGESSTLPSFKLQPAQEFLLWKAWTEEVSGWLDKYDAQTHFRDTFPIIAKGRPHLKYAMLSLSARYLETRNKNIPPSLTLALYQHSIQLLVPQLYMRDIAVIASCVVLCVLEMFSCSPKAWRRHLDGCASLMQSLNLRGDSGGPEEAVFWCFARMDLCGGLISLERTLIPIDKWTSESITEVTVSSYPRTGAFQDYAKMISNLIAQAMDLFASYHASEGAFGFASANPTQNEAYGQRWRHLFDNVLEWFDTRPTEMLPVMSMSAKESGSAFPTVLYSNAAAISGNQFAHTAAIMMLQRKPRDMVMGKVRSILWHARQICGIALSNDHHGAWTNTVQPIWIAGRLMSHPQEHAAIVALLGRIERETGWATQWRIDDLMEHWGDPDD